MDEAKGVTDILRRHIIPHVRIFKLYHSEAWSEWYKKQEILCFEESKWLKLNARTLRLPMPVSRQAAPMAPLWAGCRWLQRSRVWPRTGHHGPVQPRPSSSRLQQHSSCLQTWVRVTHDTWGAVMMIACLTQIVGVVNKMNAIRMIKLLLKESDGWLIVKVMPRKDL